MIAAPAAVAPAVIAAMNIDIVVHIHIAVNIDIVVHVYVSIHICVVINVGVPVRTRIGVPVRARIGAPVRTRTGIAIAATPTVNVCLCPALCMQRCRQKNGNGYNTEYSIVASHGLSLLVCRSLDLCDRDPLCVVGRLKYKCRVIE